ncbi:hypothetical protein L9F63_023118, partial [Diploptera punctata]
DKATLHNAALILRRKILDIEQQTLPEDITTWRKSQESFRFSNFLASDLIYNVSKVYQAAEKLLYTTQYIKERSHLKTNMISNLGEFMDALEDDKERTHKNTPTQDVDADLPDYTKVANKKIQIAQNIFFGLIFFFQMCIHPLGLLVNK